MIALIRVLSRNIRGFARIPREMRLGSVISSDGKNDDEENAEKAVFLRKVSIKTALRKLCEL